MSKTFQLICFVTVTTVALLMLTSSAFARMTDVSVAIDGQSVRVAGRNSGSAPSFLYFPTTYAGVQRLDKRISTLEMINTNGAAVTYEQMADGVFSARESISAWSYRVELKPSGVAASAHVSWLADDRGLLMLADLLPESVSGQVRLTLHLPKGWSVFTTAKRESLSVFLIDKPADFVFAVGERMRTTSVKSGATTISLVSQGEWQVEDKFAAEMIGEIFEYYRAVFGAPPFTDVLVYRGKFPVEVGIGRWQAETRGAQITLLSSEMNFKTQSEQRLHEQLRHEIFHLWIPNGVALKGSYDWFFEGFAIYAALKSAALSGRIRFEDFLATIAQAHALDALQSPRSSLTRSSQSRFSGNTSQIYVRGLLVAFLTDVRLLSDSKGRDSAEKMLAEFYTRHRRPASEVAAEEALSRLFQSRSALRSIEERYVNGKEDIAWQSELDAAGLHAEISTGMTKLTVRPKLNGRQKALLDKLGYNGWRKKSD